MNPPQYKPVYHESWALLVGINQYMYSSPLSYACNDVDALQNILISTLGFPAQQVLTLKDVNATKQNILDEFIKFRNKANDPDDRLLFFFAGHGCTIEGNKGPVGYLVPVDGKTDDLYSLIRWDSITRDSELIGAKHILFLMDACYSGLALQRSIAPGPQRFISDLLQRPARQVITAGKSDQVVADGGGPQGLNSIFTGYLIEGLNGKACNDEGILTASSLMFYVYQKVGQNPDSEQTPHYGHLEGDGDFVLITPDQEHIHQGLSTDYILEAVSEQLEVTGPTPIVSSKPYYANQCGYASPDNPNFGRNDLTKNLGEDRSSKDSHGVEKAFSWLGVMIEPLVNQSINIDIANKASDRSNIYTPGDQPYEKFSLPFSLRTTSSSLLMFSDQYNRPYWERFLKIESSGNIEYAESRTVFIEFKEHRIFKLIQIIGLTWQLLFLAKRFLHEVGYGSSVRLTFGLVGTRDTILSNFSQKAGLNNEIWRDPLVDPFGLSHIDYSNKCLDPNIKIWSSPEFCGHIRKGS